MGEIISQNIFFIKIQYDFNLYKKHGYQNTQIIERIDKLHQYPFEEFENGSFYLSEVSQWTRRVPVWEGKQLTF